MSNQLLPYHIVSASMGDIANKSNIYNSQQKPTANSMIYKRAL